MFKGNSLSGIGIRGNNRPEYMQAAKAEQSRISADQIKQQNLQIQRDRAERNRLQNLKPINKTQLGFKANTDQLTSAGIPFGLPNYSSLLNNAGTGWKNSAIEDRYTVKNSYDPKYMNSLNTYATSTSDSPWLKLMKEQAATDAGIQRADLNKQYSGGLATAQDNLAMRGGLNSGAGSALQSSGLRDLMMGRQKIGQGQYGSNMANSLAEQTSKLDVLKNMPALEQQRAQMANEINTQNVAALGNERGRQYAAGQGNFAELMKAWAAQKQAAATAAAKPESQGLLQGVLDVPGWFGGSW